MRKSTSGLTLKRRKAASGLTIVELLIVIIVIAILAVISIVAYTGIQQRANNSKTINAVAAYIKALQMYKVDEGQYPPASSCLGTVDCDSTSGYDVDKGGLNSTYLSSYLGDSLPTPATNLGQYSSSRQIGGAWYAWNSGPYGGASNGGIGLYHQGIGSCPNIGSLTFRSSDVYADGSGLWCRYSLD